MPPTIVLVHGAFAESASWDRVIRSLEGPGHDVIAAANPLRGLAADAQSVTDLVSSIDGPVVLVGHSYGGMVITNVDANAGNITGLVYVAAFAPDTGESAFSLAQRFPGSTLGDALRPVHRSNGTTDLYIDRENFHEQFAADVPAPEAARMAVTQRPVTLEALQAPSGDRPLWKEIPSWYLVAGAGPQHPGRAPALHGPPGRSPADRRAPHRLARRGRLAPRRDRAPDPRSRRRARERRGLTFEMETEMNICNTHEIQVTVVSAGEAEYGTAELWSGGRMIGFTRLDDGDLMLRIDTAVEVSAHSLANAIAEANRLLALY